jgi:ABC-type transport system involved in cytochrome c biogenesis ATPase subunit
VVALVDAHLERGGAVILTTHQEVAIAARTQFSIMLEG